MKSSFWNQCVNKFDHSTSNRLNHKMTLVKSSSDEPVNDSRIVNAPLMWQFGRLSSRLDLRRMIKFLPFITNNAEDDKAFEHNSVVCHRLQCWLSAILVCKHRALIHTTEEKKGATINRRPILLSDVRKIRLIREGVSGSRHIRGHPRVRTLRVY